MGDRISCYLQNLVNHSACLETEVLLKVINASKKLNFGAAALICEVKIALMYQVGSK